MYIKTLGRKVLITTNKCVIYLLDKERYYNNYFHTTYINFESRAPTKKMFTDI